MRKYFLILILVGLLGVGYAQFKDEVNARVGPLVHQIAISLGLRHLPCEQPIPYTLGIFDERFGISPEYFLDALEEAEAIWEESFGKELFAYQEGDADSELLQVNLVYDYRQETTSTLSELGSVVQDNRESYDELRAKFFKQRAEFEELNSEYERLVARFNERQESWNAQVEYWNERGGAPKEEYNALQKERRELDAQVSSLQIMQRQVNVLVREINTLAATLNQMASSLNLSVEKYNTIGEVLGESFQGGVYESDGITEKIDIYEFSSRVKLVRILAHELGHALGIIEHVEDPDAVMYHLNQGNKKTLTLADIDALNVVCGVK